MVCHFICTSVSVDANVSNATGEKARDIFVKSKLSNEQLLQIWSVNFWNRSIVTDIYTTGIWRTPKIEALLMQPTSRLACTLYKES